MFNKWLANRKRKQMAELRRKVREENEIRKHREKRYAERLVMESNLFTLQAEVMCKIAEVTCAPNYFNSIVTEKLVEAAKATLMLNASNIADSDVGYELMFGKALSTELLKVAHVVPADKLGLVKQTLIEFQEFRRAFREYKKIA